MNDESLLAKILAGVSLALTIVATWAWNHTHKRIDEKADRFAFDALAAKIEATAINKDLFAAHVLSDERQLASMSEEAERMRQTISKLFDRLEASEVRMTLKLENLDHSVQDKFTRIMEVLGGHK